MVAKNDCDVCGQHPQITEIYEDCVWHYCPVIDKWTSPEDEQMWDEYEQSLILEQEMAHEKALTYHHHDGIDSETIKEIAHETPRH